MKKIAGMNFHVACNVLRATTPQMIQTMPVAASMNGDDGRLPTWASSGSGTGPVGAGRCFDRSDAFLDRSDGRSRLTPASYRPSEHVR